MTVRTILFSAADSDRTVMRAQFICAEDLAQDFESFHMVQIGVARGNRTDILGSFSSMDRSIAQSAPVDLLAEQNVGFRMEEGDVLVADLTTSGSPPTILGSGIMFHVGHVLPRPVSRIADRPLRAALDGIIDYAESVGSWGHDLFVPLARSDGPDEPVLVQSPDGSWTLITSDNADNLVTSDAGFNP